MTIKSGIRFSLEITKHSNMRYCIKDHIPPHKLGPIVQ